MILKQFKAEVAQSLERSLAEIMYEAARISGEFRVSLSESTLGTKREVANCISILSSRLTSFT